MLNMCLGLICFLWLSCCFFNDAAAFLSYAKGTLVVSARAHHDDAINGRSDRILSATFRASETVSRAAAVTFAARAFVAAGAAAATVNPEGLRPSEAARSVEELVSKRAHHPVRPDSGLTDILSITCTCSGINTPIVRRRSGGVGDSLEMR